MKTTRRRTSLAGRIMTSTHGPPGMERPGRGGGCNMRQAGGGGPGGGRAHRAPSAMAKHSVRMWSATTRYAMSLLPLSCASGRGSMQVRGERYGSTHGSVMSR